MQEVFVHHDLTVVGLHKSTLEQAGIACFIRNENTSASLGAGFLGLVQSPIFNPVLCIVDDDRYDEAEPGHGWPPSNDHCISRSTGRELN